METMRPSFVKVMFEDSYPRLIIPPGLIKYMKSDVTNLPKEFIVEEALGSRVWHVDMEKDDKYFYILKGWKELAKGNCLKQGVVLVFRYEGDFKFKLEIFGRNCCKRGVPLYGWNKRISTTDHHQADDDDHDKKQRLMCLNSVKKRKRNVEASTDANTTSVNVMGNQNRSSSSSIPLPAPLEAAKNFKSQYPFFKALLRPAYVRKSYVHLPRVFVRNNRLTTQKVKLQVSNKTWSVSLVHCPQHARLVSQWGRFVEDNSLQVNDVCIFELVDTSDVTFRVTVLRNNGS